MRIGVRLDVCEDVGSENKYNNQSTKKKTN